jgi:hypothetical protein
VFFLVRLLAHARSFSPIGPRICRVGCPSTVPYETSRREYRLASVWPLQIVARNQRFRGRAGKQVRSDYIRMVLEETDLVILPHEYGYCVYRAEVARCGGVWARVGLSTCNGCANFAVAPVHTPFWERRREDGKALLADLNTLAGRETAAAAVRDMIAEADSVLVRITATSGGQ